MEKKNAKRFIASLISILMAGQFYGEFKKITGNTVISLPKSIVDDKEIPSNRFAEVNEEKNINENITKEFAMYNYVYLHIDMLNMKDLSFLSNFKNTKILLISNPSFLTEENISMINNLNAEHVYLDIEKSDINILSNPSSIDLNKINNMFFYKDEYYDNEWELLLFDRYKKQLEESMGKDYYDKLNEMNSYIDEKIIPELMINEGDDIVSKIVKISLYMCNRLQYDRDILKQKEKDEYDIETSPISNYYNMKPFSSLYDKSIEQKNELKLTKELENDLSMESLDGICINYTILCKLLCNKLGIDNNMLFTESHTWNYIRIDDKDYKHFDLTAIDGLGDEYLLPKEIKSNKIIDLYKDLFNECFLTDDSKKLNYSLEKDDYYKEQIEDIMLNEGIEGKKIPDDKDYVLDLSLFLMLGALTPECISSLYEIRKMKKSKSLILKNDIKDSN